MDSHVADSWLKDLQDLDIHLEDQFEVFTIDKDYNLAVEGIEVNAWFLADWAPLTQEDIRRGGLILGWSREDLLELVSSLTPDHMNQEFEGERWSIAGVLSHVANAENWYLSRLDLTPHTHYQLPDDPFDRLHLVRTRMEAVLPTLAGKEEVCGVEGEFWSPRKILRRATWHEIDHIEHIFKLISRL